MLEGGENKGWTGREGGVQNAEMDDVARTGGGEEVMLSLSLKFLAF